MIRCFPEALSPFGHHTCYLVERLHHMPARSTRLDAKAWIAIIMVLLIIGFVTYWMLQTPPGEAEHKISGKVVDARNRPLAGIPVEFLQQYTLTDDRGEFTFPFQPRDTVVLLTVGHPEHGTPLTREVNLNTSEDLEFLFVFHDQVASGAGATTPGNVAQPPSTPPSTSPSTTTPPPSTVQAGLAALQKGIENRHYAVTLANDYKELVRQYQQRRDNYRLVAVEPLYQGGEFRYLSVWHPGGGKQRLWRDRSPGNLRSRQAQYRREGLHLANLEVFSREGTLWYLGIWHPGAQGNSRLEADLTWNEFLYRWGELARKDFRLIDAEVYSTAGGIRYAGVWQADTRKFRLWKTTSIDTLLNKQEEYYPLGLRLHDLEVFVEGGKTYYLGVWLESGDEMRLWLNQPLEQFVNQQNQAPAQTLQLLDVEAYSTAGGVSFFSLLRELGR